MSDRSGGVVEAVFAVGANCALGAEGAVGAGLRSSEAAGAVGVPLRDLSGWEGGTGVLGAAGTIGFCESVLALARHWLSTTHLRRGCPDGLSLLQTGEVAIEHNTVKHFVTLQDK